MTVQQDDHRWMNLAIEQAKLCPVAEDAFSVGAIIVDADSDEVSRDYSPCDQLMTAHAGRK